MATSPISKSATQSGAAKDDVVGLNGDFTFTITDLLGNDPGGAAKVNVDTQFFFGDAPPNGGIPSIEAQVIYLNSLGITAHLNDAGTSFVSFDIGADAKDFNYFVQIGNKGTWSEAHVDVADTPDPVQPLDTHHDGKLAVEWTFENHTADAGDEIGYHPTGFWNMEQWAANHSADYPEADDAFPLFASNMQVHGVDGQRALDTAASPGNIFLQAITQGYDGASMPDLVTGQEYHAEVRVLKQDYSLVPEAVAAGHEGTDPDAWVTFKFNDTVLAVHANDTAFDGHANEYLTFDVTFKGVEGQDSFFIMSHGTGDDAQGLLIDSIQVHDWIV